MTSPRRLVLNDDLTIYHALEQKHRLLDALAGTDDLELDLLRVAEIDTAGLQLLLLLQREARRAGKRVAIAAASPPVRALIGFCNLAAELGEPPGAAA